MKHSKSMVKAANWVQRLMNLLAEMDQMDKRTSAAAAKLLRAGCAHTVYAGKNELWDALVIAYPDLDTGEALLHLSNRTAWNADQGRWSLEDIYKEFKC